MKKLIPFLLPLLITPVQAEPLTALMPVYSAASSIPIQAGYSSTATDKPDVLFVRWDTYNIFGSIIHHCSITRVDEFLELSNGHTISLITAIYTQTPSGSQWNWTTTPSSNINPWCLQ